MITVKDELELHELCQQQLEVGTEIKVLNYMLTGKSVVFKVEKGEEDER